MALSTSRNYGYFIPEFLDISEFPSRVPKCLKVGPFLTSFSYSQNSSDMYKTHQKIYICHWTTESAERRMAADRTQDERKISPG